MSDTTTLRKIIAGLKSELEHTEQNVSTVLYVERADIVAIISELDRIQAPIVTGARDGGDDKQIFIAGHEYGFNRGADRPNGHHSLREAELDWVESSQDQSIAAPENTRD